MEPFTLGWGVLFAYWAGLLCRWILDAALKGDKQ